MGVSHPAWSKHAAIYQVNLRQYTPEGTLAAFEAQLPRIAQLMGGQGILWFMPLQPIGELHRKGGMGSYYSVRDYTAVNPEFGTLDEVRRVVDRAHALGLKVIIDWVANHTAWDHRWVTEHPDWYRKDPHGQIHAYVYRASPESEPEYWTDVVGLDWAQPAVWDAMEDAMLFWMRETGIDGFRCDVAALVPIGFWERMRPRLEAIRPVYLLAEAHEPIHHRAAFDATYDWDLYETLRRATRGAEPAAAALHAWWARRCAHYGADDHRMAYTANHDSNSWHGSCEELYGSPEAFKAAAVLAATLPGMPLVYGGQEGYFRKRLAFFEKDPIDWGERPLEGFYADLLNLKRLHPALANGAAGGSLEWIEAGGQDAAVVAFHRRAAADAAHAEPAPVPRLSVAVNLSSRTASWAGFDGRGAELPPWGCVIDAGG